MIKKLAFLMTFLVTTTVFSGCSLFSPTSDAESFEGVLTEQISGDQYPGTHLLTSDNGEIRALTSTVLNLSSEQYLGNKVKVLGNFNETEKVVEVTGISVIEVLPKDGGKANWTSYINQSAGFKLKYYDSWQVTDWNNNEIKFHAPLAVEAATPEVNGTKTPDTVSIVRLENKDKKPLNDFINEKGLSIFGENPLTSYTITDSKIGLNQQDAKKYQLSTNPEVHFVLTRDDYVYVISYYPFENANDNNERTFYEMLLEFQFVPFSDTAPVTTTPETGTTDTTASTATTTTTNGATPTTTVPTTTGTPTTTPVTSPITTDKPVVPVTTVTTPVTTDKPVVTPPAASTDTTDYSSFSEFESIPYHFRVKYPSSWYYAGTKGVEEGVLHKYSFSNQPVTDENEFASLKVLSGDLPSGQSVTLPNGQSIKKYEGTSVFFYVKVNDKVYCVQGAKDKEDLLQKIAGSITYLSEAQPAE